MVSLWVWGLGFMKTTDLECQPLTDLSAGEAAAVAEAVQQLRSLSHQGGSTAQLSTVALSISQKTSAIPSPFPKVPPRASSPASSV